MISQVWATIARIWTWPWQVWQVSDVPPSTVVRTWGVVFLCNETTPCTAGKQSSQSANSFQLFSSRTLMWRTWKTPYRYANQNIPACTRSVQNCYRREPKHTTIGEGVFGQIGSQKWDGWFIWLGYYQRENPNHLEPNEILLGAMCEQGGANKQQWVQLV